MFLFSKDHVLLSDPPIVLGALTSLLLSTLPASLVRLVHGYANTAVTRRVGRSDRVVLQPGELVEMTATSDTPSEGYSAVVHWLWLEEDTSSSNARGDPPVVRLCRDVGDAFQCERIGVDPVRLSSSENPGSNEAKVQLSRGGICMAVMLEQPKTRADFAFAKCCVLITELGTTPLEMGRRFSVNYEVDRTQSPSPPI